MLTNLYGKFITSFKEESVEIANSDRKLNKFIRYSIYILAVGHLTLFGFMSILYIINSSLDLFFSLKENTKFELTIIPVNFWLLTARTVLILFLFEGIRRAKKKTLKEEPSV